MRGFNEFVQTPVGVILGIALGLVLFLTGIGVMNALIGPSWAEICVAQGGEYNINYNEGNATQEWCDMP